MFILGQLTLFFCRTTCPYNFHQAVKGHQLGKAQLVYKIRLRAQIMHLMQPTKRASICDPGEQQHTDIIQLGVKFDESGGDQLRLSYNRIGETTKQMHLFMKFKPIFRETSKMVFNENNREFKIYDATVAKTSLKIASSSFFYFVMSVSLTLKASRTTQELNLEVRCQRQKRIFKFAPECSRSL